MKNVSIKIKLVILILIILVPLTILQIVKIRAQYENSIEAELRASQDLAEAISTSFLNYLEEIWSEELGIGLLYSSEYSSDISYIEDYMKEMVRQEETVLGYTLTDAEGTIIACTKEGFVGKSIRDREYFQRILDGEEKVVSNLVRVDNGKIAGLPVARAIYKDDKLLGVVSSIASVNTLEGMLPSKRLGQGSHFALTDRDGTIFYHSGPETMDIEEINFIEDYNTSQALNGKITKIFDQRSFVEEPLRMGIAYPISKIGFTCLVTNSVGELLGKHVEAAKRDFIILVLVAILSILVASKFANLIVDPLLSLKTAATRITKGDLTARTNISSANSTVKDEIVATAEAFDYMATHIEMQDHFKNQFFATISHELKTPLNIILGTIQLLKTMEIKTSEHSHFQPLGKYTGIMQQNCYRLLRLINNLLDITKMDAQFLNLHLEDCDIVKVVEDITLSVAQYVEESNKVLVFDTDIEEKVIACDPDKIERVMLNLLSNAVKFTEKDGKIEVNIFGREEYIFISVKDDGIGIPLDQLDIIFERFKQVDATLTRKTEGTGIGLSLVKGLVEAHGGEVLVKSEHGKGSEFIVILPVKTTGINDNGENELSGTGQTNIERIQVEFSDIYS